LDAFVVGFEVAARLGRLLNPEHYERGWHATSTLGAPAAAAAVARLLRLDVATTRAALGIAGSLAAGLRVSFGSMVKPLHAGHAARTGVLAARLAAGGFTAAPQLFEAPRGFFELFGAAADWSSAFDGWDWSAPAIVRSGIQVKPFPSCACTHTGIDAMLALREQLNGQPVERIACRVSPVVPQILIHERPTTGLEGKFSMHYALAVTLLDGQPGLAQFGDERVRQDDVQSLLRRVELQTDASLVEDLTTGLLPVQVSVELADGRRLEANCELAPGSPERPLSRVQLEQKFLGNAGLVLGEERAAAALAALRGVREMPGVRRLVDYLTCQGAL
jgi:2-methylcitrate dehydratase PrpD